MSINRLLGEVSKNHRTWFRSWKQVLYTRTPGPGVSNSSLEVKGCSLATPCGSWYLGGGHCFFIFGGQLFSPDRVSFKSHDPFTGRHKTTHDQKLASFCRACARLLAAYTSARFQKKLQAMARSGVQVHALGLAAGGCGLLLAPG